MTRVSTWSARSWPAGDSSRGHVVKFIAHQLYLLNNRTKWMQVNWFRSFICHGDAYWPLQATIIGEMFESREMPVPAGDERATKWHFIRGKNQRKVKKTKAISCGHWLKLQVDVPLFFKLGLNAIPFGRLPAPWSPVAKCCDPRPFRALKNAQQIGVFLDGQSYDISNTCQIAPPLPLDATCCCAPRPPSKCAVSLSDGLKDSWRQTFCHQFSSSSDCPADSSSRSNCCLSSWSPQ